VVPADDEVTSQSAIGGNAYHTPAAFTTTHWSVVLEAQGESPPAQKALEKLCRVYWRPIYSLCGDRMLGRRKRRILPKVFGFLVIDVTGGVGTYTVAADCTGTLSITNGPTFNMYVGPGAQQLWLIQWGR
jgi:hypothetical protein